MRVEALSFDSMTGSETATARSRAEFAAMSALVSLSRNQSNPVHFAYDGEVRGLHLSTSPSISPSPKKSAASRFSAQASCVAPIGEHLARSRALRFAVHPPRPLDTFTRVLTAGVEPLARRHDYPGAELIDQDALMLTSS